MGNKLFSGTYTALATPFKNGVIDEESFGRLVKSQIDGGVRGFIVNGTTGESPTLEVNEVKNLVELVRKKSPAKTQIILGVGTNNTQSSLEWIHRANQWKVDGALAVVPYYNKPPQRGLIQHFETLADASETPVILYNVPGRTIQSLDLSSIQTLAQHKMISGIKESTGDIKFCKEIKQVIPDDFCLLSGDDGSATEFCLSGGDGVIGVITHLIPKIFSQIISRALSGDSESLNQAKDIKELIDSIYVESNPIPVKMGLQLLGIFDSAELRLPLVELSLPLTERLKACLQKFKVL